MKFNSNLGRGLIAFAVAGSCGYLSAATVSTTAVSYTEAAINSAAATADIATSNILVSLGAAYSISNQLTLTLQNGAQFSGAAANVAASVNCQSGASNDMVLSYQAGGGSGSTSVRYVVQSLSGTPTTASLTCNFGSRSVLARTMPTSGSVGVQYSAATSGGSAIDDGAVATAAIATSRAQFAFGSFSGVSGVIDVTNGRLAFTAAPTAKPNNPAIDATLGATTADGIQVRFNAFSLGASTSAAQQTFEVTINGDFTFADDTGGECSAADLSTGNGQVTARIQHAGLAAGATASGVSLTCATNAQSVTLKVDPTAMRLAADNAGQNVNATITLKRGGATTAGVQFVRGDYTGAAPAFAYGTGTLSSNGGQSTTWSAGSFTSNGVTIDVPYMPFGNAGTSAIGHVFVLHNRSNQAGTVSISAFKNGSTTACATNSSLVTVEANSVTNISDQVRTYIANCWPTDSAVRAGLRFEANLPASTSELYTSFTIGSDRALVPNSSTGRGAPRSN